MFKKHIKLIKSQSNSKNGVAIAHFNELFGLI
jgi:hypothetical protein